MAEPDIELIVGLGNPGDKYARTRHNAGFWFVDELARRSAVDLRPEKKFHGRTARATIGGASRHLLMPDTFMNLSGDAVQALASFYKLAPESILVVHDDIDLPPGTARLKRGGGHGGNNGLRDISQKIGKAYVRLRIGVGRPTRGEVIDHVLGRPSPDDQIEIERALDAGHAVLPILLEQGLERAMHRLHSKPSKPAASAKAAKAEPAGRSAKPAAQTPDASAAAGRTADVPPEERADMSLRGQLADWFRGKR